MNLTDNRPSNDASHSLQPAASASSHDSRLSTAQLTVEWADRCIELLRPMDWPGRMDALMQLHDQLRSDFVDFETFCHVFPNLIAQTIERLGASPVTELDQAHIYSNSANTAHRKEAGAWLKGNGRPGA